MPSLGFSSISAVLSHTEPCEADPIAARALRATAEWIATFLARPHSSLGRAGTVCPYVPRALELDTIFLAAVRGSSPTPREIDALIEGSRARLRPPTGASERTIFSATLMVFPDLAPSDAKALIDGAQDRLKPEMVREGLMIGEFHERNDTPGLHSPAFFPLRSPYPLLAVRGMVESDIVFLARASDPAARRVLYLEGYLAALAPALPRAAVARAESLLASAVEERGT